MDTERVQQHEHNTVLKRIANVMASVLWEDRLAVIELVQGLLRDLPTERTVERLVEILAYLAQDTKWEVRRAAVPALVDVGRPTARRVLEQLTGDANQWVRHAAERAIRKLTRKRDRKARLTLETIKDLEGRAVENLYEAAVLVGEKYYEELVGDTAHELNTYRAAMDGLLQELELEIRKSNGTSPHVSDILAKIRNRSRYLKTLCGGLVEYTRDGDLDFQLQLLRPIVSDALGLAREKASACLVNQEIEVICDISGEIEIEACRDRLVQALVNILSNAFESHVGKGSDARIQIAAEPRGSGRLAVIIADRGCGMDPAQLESATKRFRSLKKQYGGIGLGLPLALKIIEREHEGSLDIESELGSGTIVTINLPMKRGHH